MTERNKINCSKIKIPCWLLVIGGFFIWPIFVSGATNDVIINEIAWMGTDASSADEWLELYNNTGQGIDLTGWTLKAKDGTPEIILDGTIAADGYFLLERTDDNSVPAITADLIYAGALGNSGENLELRDTENNLIDQVDCSEAWLAGDNETKQTMKKTDNQWQTSLNPGGTPKAQNSKGQETLPEETEEPPAEEPSIDVWIPPTVVNQPPMAKAGPDITVLANQEISFDASLSFDPDNDRLAYFWNFGDGATDTQEKTTHTYLYPGQYIVSLMVDDGEFYDLDIITVNVYSQPVLISEFVPNQWIEIFNQSKQIANLTGWQLNNFVFPVNSLIAPEQFLVLAFNDGQSQVRLFYPDGSLATEISYGQKTEKELSVAFDGQEYFWTKVLTPGLANIISASPSSHNPQSIIHETQESPEILANLNLNQSQEFSALNQPAQESPQQTASLVQSSQSNQKANLILTLSIIISGALLASWFLIRLTLSRNQ